MPPKRTRSPSPSILPPNLFRSPPIIDRSSRFIALYSSTAPVKELQSLPELATASHRMTAWRIASSQRARNPNQQLFDTGHDDDGEKYGGKALQTVLCEMEVEGAVVVGRWFGGVLLGPVRFEHIKTCAREAIALFTIEQEEKVKRVKIEDEERRREELIRVLPERDQSVSVLRDLLAEKQEMTGSAKAEKRSSAKVPEYSTLPLSTLESLERARDASIGWILKQIEKVETILEGTQAKTPTERPASAALHRDLDERQGAGTDGDPKSVESGTSAQQPDS